MRWPFILGGTLLVVLLIGLLLLGRTYKKNGHGHRCGTTSCTVYLFHSPTCPHCVRAMPEFKSFEEWARPKYPNMKVVRVSLPDATPEQRNMIRCLNITRVPTVLFVGRDGAFHFLDGSCTEENLREKAKKVWS